jgi:flagellar basal body-associated protein FliL
MKHNAEKSRLQLLYIASMAILLALAAFGAFWVGEKELTPIAPPAPNKTEPNKAANIITDKAYLSLPRMTVSLGKGGTMQVRMDISLEVAPEDIIVLEGYVPQIVDKLNAYFPKVKFEELDQPHAMFLFHKNMLWQINNLGMPVTVRDLTLKNMILM